MRSLWKIPTKKRKTFCNAQVLLDVWTKRDYNHHMNKQKQFKKSRFAEMRAQMAEYGFALQLVMCGKVANGRFYLTNRTSKRTSRNTHP